MRITPLRQAIAYGTTVTISVTIGGALWFDRSGAAANRVKVDDYVMLYQSTLEKCLATEYVSDPQSLPLPVVSRTNYARAWAVDSLHTNYLASTGDDAEYVVTDTFGGHTYLVSLPDPGFLEFSGDKGDKYIWNAYSNITVSGISSAVNGLYSLNTIASALDLEDDYAGIWVLISPWSEYRKLNVLVYVYTNTTGLTLFDFGPLETYGWLDEAEGMRSCVIADTALGIGSQTKAFTHRQDSPFHGPWFTGDVFSEALAPSGEAAGSVFVTNMLRDAVCRWYINKQSGDYLWASNTPSGYDPKYYYPNYHGIGPDVTGTHLDLIEEKIEALCGAGYIRTDAGSDFSGYTNIVQFFQLSEAVTFSNVASWASVDVDYTNSVDPTIDDVERLAKLLQEFDWTRYDASWWAHGYIGGSTGVIYTNVFYGSGESTSSWSEAKGAAESSLAPALYLLHATPCAITEGTYQKTGGGVEYWTANITTIHSDLCYAGATTSLTADADFYVYGASPYVADGPGEITQEDTCYATFDDNGHGVVFGQYNLVETVEKAMTNSAPYITLGFGQTTPAWCDNPASLYTEDETTFITYRGYCLEGFNGTNSAQIIMRWDWAYNTDPL